VLRLQRDSQLLGGVGLHRDEHDVGALVVPSLAMPSDVDSYP
jgi:hypothetical protein